MDAARSLVAAARAAIQAAETSVGAATSTPLDDGNTANAAMDEGNDFATLAAVTAGNFRRRRRRDATAEGDIIELLYLHIITLYDIRVLCTVLILQ